MSYHAQKSTGQRSFGLLFVIGFHIVLIYGLASGLAGNVSTKISEVLQTKVVEEVKPDEVVEPPPPPPDTKIPPPDFVPPPLFDFVPDAPANTTAIQAVQHAVPPKVAEPTTLSKAKPTSKGLSRPEYPSASIRLGEEGLVGLQLYINEDGRVGEAKIASSSGFERLDDAAVKETKKRFIIPYIEESKKYVLPNLSFEANDDATRRATMADVQTYVDEMIIKFIIGQEPMENWDKYVQKVKTMQMDKVIAIYQKSFDSYNSKK